MIDSVLEQKIDKWVEDHREEFIRDWISLVNIKSVSTPGEGGYAFGSGCARCLDRALELGKSWGLEAENDDYYCGSVILKGAGGGEMGVVGHLDVVPEGPGWHFDPYNAVCREGYVIGRGAGDNKGPVTTSLYAARCLKELGVPLRRSVRVLMGCDEENGMRDMDHFLACHSAPDFSLCCDGTFALHHGEKGILTADLSAEIDDGRLVDFHGGAASNSVAAFAQARLSGLPAERVEAAIAGTGCVLTDEGGALTVSAEGLTRHAAFPEGSVNAIAKLAGALSGKGLFTAQTERALDFLARAFSDYYGAGLDIPYADELSGKLTHAGGMARLEGRTLIQNINVRYPITMADSGPMLARLNARCAENGYTVSVTRDSPPMFIPLENPILQMLIRTCREVLRRDDLSPFVMGGGTHCRKIPNMVGYGPTVPHADGTIGPSSKARFGDAHGPDEAKDIQSMLDGIKVYVVTLMRLDEMLDRGV